MEELLKRAKGRKSFGNLIWCKLQEDHGFIDVIKEHSVELDENYPVVHLNHRLGYLYARKKIPKCPHCGKVLAIKNKPTKFVRYYKTCGDKKCIESEKKTTYIEKYDVDSPSKCFAVQKKMKSTMMERYGVEHSGHSEELMSKQKKSAFTFKDYIMPDGEVIRLQGYEDRFLDEYFSGGGRQDNLGKPPVVKYNFAGKNRRYYPDFYLIEENKIIEVKSTWTYEKWCDKNLAKRDACLAAGYDFEFCFYAENGKRVDLKLHPLL